jgi:hypothetical protein
MIPMNPAEIIPMPYRAELIGAGMAKDHKAIEKIRKKIMVAHPELYRFRSSVDERKAAGIPE